MGSSQMQFLVFAASFFTFIWVIHNALDMQVAALLGVVTLSSVLAIAISFVVSLALPRGLLNNLNNKAILITGCGSGFGNSLARKLDGYGVTVYAGCRRIDCDGAKELQKTCSKNLRIVPLDVTKEEDVTAALKFVESTLGDKELWAVVNNAGISSLSELEWLPTQVFKDIAEVNVFGQVRVTKAFLPLLRKSKGRIVNVSSMAGRLTCPTLVPYSMSKFAAVVFTEGLRMEMKKFSISVHSIEPWIYRTRFVDLSYKSLADNWDGCPSDVKKAYGHNYGRLTQERSKLVLDWLTIPDNKTYMVIDDMVDACIGSSPKDRYVPGLLAKLMNLVADILPRFLADHITDFITQPRTFPIPEHY